MTSALPPTGPPPAADPAGGWPPPPPPGPAPRPQLRRSRTDKVLGGVAGGLADYTGIDALLWRVGAIALTFAGGSGIIIYLLLWLLMAPAPPAQPGEAAAAVAQRSGPRSPVPGITVAALLLLAGVGVLIAQVTDWDLDAGRVFAIGLLVVGIGLAVAAVTGAGRASKGGLAAVGVVLALGAVTASTVDFDASRHGTFGDRTFRPATAEQVRSSYDGGVGDLTIDLGGIDLAGRTSPVV